MSSSGISLEMWRWLADSFAFEVAINRAWDEARSNIIQRISERMPDLAEKPVKAV